MRLLHPWPNLFRRRPDSGRESGDTRRYPRVDERQPLPVRRGSKYHRRDPGRDEDDVRRDKLLLESGIFLLLDLRPPGSRRWRTRTKTSTRRSGSIVIAMGATRGLLTSLQVHANRRGIGSG